MVYTNRLTAAATHSTARLHPTRTTSQFLSTMDPQHDPMLYGYLQLLSDIMILSLCGYEVPTSRGLHELLDCSCHTLHRALHPTRTTSPVLTTMDPQHDLIVYGYLHLLPGIMILSACGCEVPTSRNLHERLCCSCHTIHSTLCPTHITSPFLTTMDPPHDLIVYGYLQ